MRINMHRKSCKHDGGKMKIKRIDYGKYMMGIEEVVEACRNNDLTIGSERYIIYHTMIGLFTDINIDDYEVDDLMEMVYSKKIIEAILKEKQAKDFYDDVMRALNYYHNESKFDDIVKGVMDGDDTTIKELAEKLYAEEKVL